MATRPNILYIHSHDTGRYVQPYGHAIATPRIQALADDGVLFRNAFCAAPTCSPSRAALVTGLYPHQNGMFGLAHRGWDLNDYGEHVLHALKAAGYRTALSGVQHIVAAPRTAEIGYDEVLIPPRTADSPELAAASFVHRQRRSDEPFFLAVGFGETHRPFPTSDWSVDPAHVQPPAPLPDVPEVREDMAGYITLAGTLDRKMGTVFDALRETGQWDNTLIICTTDHGIAFPRMKCNLTDDGIGVMLILRGPDGLSGGRVVDGLASHIDLVPTMCAAAGIDVPEGRAGQDLAPLARGEVASVRDEVHAEVNYHACYEPMRCVRTDRYKYIRRFGDRTAPVLPNCDDSLSKDVAKRCGWFPIESEALFDTWLDPHETDNRIADPAAAEIAADMRGRLKRWQDATNDPVRQGPIAPPPDAVFNDIDGDSPQTKQGGIEAFPQY